MNFKKIAVLTSDKSWFLPFAASLVKILRNKGYEARLYFDHKKIGDDFKVVFMLSYFRIVEKGYLKRHMHNLVVHESDLPHGKGWAPLFWQILDGENKIPVVLFEADPKADNGRIYIKDYLTLKGDELHDEIRKRQASKTIELCLRFLKEYNKLKPAGQRGRSTYYRRRSASDSKLDAGKNIKEQFNLLRIVNNEEFPAFFDYRGHRYILKISREE